MTFKYFVHMGLRQVVMVQMGWAIDVPQELLQSDAIPSRKKSKAIRL